MISNDRLIGAVRRIMVSSVSSFSGLSASNIATLFGTAASSSDPATKDGADTSSGATSGTPITGAGGGGTNAAKAIQAIVTQIQIEKTQTGVGGKVSTVSLASASVATTYGAKAPVNDNPQWSNSGTTVLNSFATATGDDLAGAVGALLGRVHAQEAQIEAQQGGLLMSKDEIVYDGHASNSSVNWTANSVTYTTNATENLGVELYQEESSLAGIQSFDAEAQQFAKPTTSDNATTSSSSSSANGPALYLAISAYHGSLSELEAQEQQIVSDFLNGAQPGQNGTAPENGAGFSMSWSNDDESAYSVSGVMISNYDPAAVARRTGGITANEQSAWLTTDQKTATLGGTLVWDQNTGGSYDMAVVIPLKRS